MTVTPSVRLRPRPEAGALPGDKGAAASAGFRLLSGFHLPTLGAIQMDGAAIALNIPRDAAAHGIATVQGFGGTFPLMSIGRSFSSRSGRQGAGAPSGCPIASGPKKSSSRFRMRPPAGPARGGRSQASRRCRQRRPSAAAAQCGDGRGRIPNHKGGSCPLIRRGEPSRTRGFGAKAA